MTVSGIRIVYKILPLLPPVNDSSDALTITAVLHWMSSLIKYCEAEKTELKPNDSHNAL